MGGVRGGVPGGNLSALDSDDDLEIPDTTASGLNTKGTEAGTVVGVSDAREAGAAEQQQARSSEGLQVGLDRDSSAAEPKARTDEAGMAAATATAAAAPAVLPLPVGSGTADGGGLETSEGQSKGGEDCELEEEACDVTELVPTPSARGSEEEGRGTGINFDGRAAAAANDDVDDVSTAIAQSSSANGSDGRTSTLLEAPMPSDQAQDCGDDGEEGDGCAADSCSTGSVDPSGDAKERGWQEPPPEGEAMPTTVAEAGGREDFQGEEDHLDNAKDTIAPGAPIHGRGGEDVNGELVPTSAEEPGDQRPTDDGVVSASAADAAVVTGVTDAVVESFGISPELDARRSRAAAAAAAAERRRLVPEYLPAPAAELSTDIDASATEGTKDRGEAHRGGDWRQQPAGPTYAVDDKMTEETVAEERLERATTVPAAVTGEVGEKTGDLAAALAASQEREDALTARLLMAEELLAERERQLESTNISMAEIMQNGGGGREGMAGAGGREDVAAVVAAAEKETISRERREAERVMAAARERHRVEVSRLEGVLEAEKKKAKAATETVKGWERRAEEFEEKDKMLKVRRKKCPLSSPAIHSPRECLHIMSTTESLALPAFNRNFVDFIRPFKIFLRAMGTNGSPRAPSRWE